MYDELNMMVDHLQNVILVLLPIVFFPVVFKVLFGFINRALRDDLPFFDDFESIEDTETFKTEDKTIKNVSNDIKYWDCAWCGTKHIKVKHLNCPNCCGTRL